MKSVSLDWKKFPQGYGGDGILRVPSAGRAKSVGTWALFTLRSNIHRNWITASDRYHTYRFEIEIRADLSWVCFTQYSAALPRMSTTFHIEALCWLLEIIFLRLTFDFHDVRRTDESIGTDHQNMVEERRYLFSVVETLHTFALSNLSSRHTHETEQSAGTSCSYREEISSSFAASFRSVERKCDDTTVRRLSA